MSENENMVAMEEVTKLKEEVFNLKESTKIFEAKLDELIGYFNEFSKQLSGIIPDIDRRLIELEGHKCKCSNEEEVVEDGQS